MSTSQKIVIVLALFGLVVSLLFIPFTHESSLQVVSGSVPIWELGDKDTIDFRSLGIVWFCIVFTASMLWFLCSKASKAEKVAAAAAFVSALFCVLVVTEKSRLVPRVVMERSENKSSGTVEFAYTVTFDSGQYRLVSAQQLSRAEMVQALRGEGKLNRLLDPADAVMTIWQEFKSKIFPEFRAQIAGPTHMALERQQMDLNRLMHPTCAAVGSIMPWVLLLVFTGGIIYRFVVRRNGSPVTPNTTESR
ncbi:hypothetical protein [Prosthecobacter sp.]